MNTNTINYKKAFYEQSELWGKYLDSSEYKKYKEIAAGISEDVESILDVGCGRGGLINLLFSLNKYDRIIGFDWSWEALRYVQAVKIQGEITNLPFKDKSFDLVICMEVLEHLEDENLERTILEIERISKKYIIITVPNNEDLHYGMTLCPICRQRFHLSLHIQNFNEEKLSKLFNNFRSNEIKKIGPIIPKIPPWQFFYILYNFYDKFFPRSRVSICPQCGYQFKNVFLIRRSIGQRLFFFTKLLARILFPFWQDYRWLFAIYKILTKI